MYLVTAGEMQKMDRLTIESFGLPGRVLMENAGRGATQILFEKFGGLKNKKVGIAAGRGNNGGDGFVIARYLAQKGIRATVYLLSKRDAIKGDAAANLKLLAPLSVPVIEIPDKKAFSTHRTSMVHQEIWVDAILGTGLKSQIKGYFREIIEFINSLNKPVFAVDIPSGLDSDTGQPCGACIRAQATATFGFAKTGHILSPGASYTGSLEIVDIGIPHHIAEDVGPKQHLLTTDLINNYFQPRPPDAHKGSTGHLLLLAGSPGKTGAAAMTAMSAMRVGAGLVTLGLPNSINDILETRILEAMTFPLPETDDGVLGESSFNAIMELLSGKRCLAIGPGLGSAVETKSLVRRVIQESTVPIVIDADGINSLAGHTKILQNLKLPVILTPHPGEMARLVDSTPQNIQKDRVGCARDFAKRFNVHVVLKGAKTVIAHPDGRAFINPTGNSGMASGGMGDVLTGMIAGLVTQGYSPETAAHAGVFLHGTAADAVADKTGPFGFLATDVIMAIPEQIGRLMKSEL
ncbi:MAG TPA: NAD(P)H-hydrate dehydratase [Anaerolineae bacterium]|nr:NAD(P)H-hydrate dehydratase [Anaerolineae bacterium]